MLVLHLGHGCVLRNIVLPSRTQSGIETNRSQTQTSTQLAKRKQLAGRRARSKTAKKVKEKKIRKKLREGG